MKPRGYSLPIVLLLLLIVTVGVFSFMEAVRGGAQASGAAIKERRVFFAADDMCRITAVMAQSYLTQTPSPSGPGLEAFVKTTAGGDALPIITPPGFVTRGEVDPTKGFEVIALGSAETRPLPSGPFEGMIAQQRPLDMRVRVQQLDGNAAAGCRQKIVLATVAAFQFYIFSEVYLDWDPVPLMTVQGRVHGNNDVCVAGATGVGNGLVGDRLTAAGRILRSSVASRVGVGKCRASQNNNNVQFATDDTFATFVQLTQDNMDVGWRAFAETTFNGRVLDVAHGVQALKLPITGSPRVQAGYNLAVTKHGEAVSTYKEDNTVNQRFVVDPILKNEPTDVREQKFAFKADIRIVNGVWYIRDDAAPEKPGVAIWSDHPGRHTVTGATSASVEQGHELFLPTDDVGQEDLRSARSWVATPRRFSMYGYDTNAAAGAGRMTRVPADPPAILSYGSVVRDPDDGPGGTTPYWYPGHWVNRSGGSTSMCLANVANTSCANKAVMTGSAISGGSAFVFTNDDQCLFRAGATGAANPVIAGCQTSAETSILNGTRSGFKSGWFEVRSKPSSASFLTLKTDQSGTPRSLAPLGSGVTRNERDRSRILPINLDVAALQAALADCTVGELGSYFPGTCTGTGRVFNGIVFVTATWPHGLDGFGSTAASSTFAGDWPFQARLTAPADPGAPQATTRDVAQPDPVPGRALYVDDQDGVGGDDVELMQNQALPFPLCSDDALTADQRIFDKVTVAPAAGRFRIPSCASYGSAAGQIGAFPNAIRIINASKVNPRVNTATAGGTLTVRNGILPRGLTIATNLPMYVLGDVNVDTTPKLSPTTTPANDYFVPVLLAADRISRHSSVWSDTDSRWGMPAGAFQRTPAATTHHFEVFSGWAQSEATTGFHDDGIENFMKYNERWSGAIEARYFGSMVAGFASVFEAAGTGSAGDGNSAFYGFGAPERIEGYDFHLDVPENQPPGAPLYNVQGIFLWQAQ
jgi:hypothetical protein